MAVAEVLPRANGEIVSSSTVGGGVKKVAGKPCHCDTGKVSGDQTQNL